jgi:hypothetical protein
MVNKAKVKGTNWETALVNFLKASHWPFARRIALAGSKDIGDISLGDTPLGGTVTIEAKDHAAITLASFVDEMQEECRNAGTEYGVVIIKRRGKNVSQAYVVTTLDMWVKDRINHG